MFRIPVFTIIVLFTLSIANAGDPSGNAARKADSLAVKEAVVTFVKALDNLNLKGFRNCFTDDVSMFFPHASRIHRVDGKEKVAKGAQQAFDDARQRLSGPPYLNLVALNMRVQMLDENSAVVTWQTNRETHTGRRTAVLQKVDGKWLFASYHASNYTNPKESD